MRPANHALLFSQPNSTKEEVKWFWNYLLSIPGSGRSAGEGNGNPLQYYCLENPLDRGAWWATVHRVAKSLTWLSDFTYTHLLSDPRDGSELNMLFVRVYYNILGVESLLSIYFLHHLENCIFVIFLPRFWISFSHLFWHPWRFGFNKMPLQGFHTT